MAFSENLELLSQIDFKFPDFFPGMKNVHHIIVDGDTAYLLDNTIDPLYIFQVGIDNPDNITLLWEYEYTDINAKLITQWLEPEKEAWAILHSAFWRTGFGMESEQGITIFMPGGEGGTYYNTYKEKHFHDRDLLVKEGSYIVADSATSPN